MKQIFQSLKISNKIAAVFLLLLFMMGVGGSVGLYNAVQIANVTEELYLDSFKKTETLTSIEYEFLTQRQELFLLTVTGENISRGFLKGSIAGHRNRINGLVDDYENLGLGTDQPEFNVLKENFLIYWSILDDIVSLSADGKKEQAHALIRGEGDRSFTNTLNSLKKLVLQERAAAYSAFQKSNFFSRVITVVTLAFTLLAIVAAAGMWLALTRSIVRPIITIEESAKKIGQGDLTQRVPVITEDEIGGLAVEFNRMATSLQGTYAVLEKKVSERTEELRVANEELSAKKHELEVTNKELEEANNMKTQFLANVSHELRTPLNSIIGFSELLQEMAFGKLNEKQLQYVEFVHSSGAHLLHLINNILELSRIDAGRMEMLKEDFPITEVLGETLGAIKPMAHERGITIETKTVPGSPVIKADKVKFKQIMMNLLSNAVKYNVDNGKVYVDWDIIEEPKGMKMESQLVLKVMDTGIGINQDDLTRLFREFEQIDHGGAKDQGGAGLSLVLTKRLVELHGGEIRAESEPGKKTVFTVKLPQGTEELDIPVLTQTGLASLGEDTNPSILIASESPDMGHLLEIYLAGGSYDVVTASDGVELLRQAEDKRPFAIIMGVTIPKKDGWEVLKELKSKEETTDIPVIIISSTDNRNLAMTLGAVEYMEKPMSREALLGVLERLRVSQNKTRRPSRVLLLDEDSGSLTQAGEMLAGEDLQVINAVNNGDALDIARDKRPDIIVLNVRKLKEKDFTLLERLNKNSSTKSTPVIVFTEKKLSSKEKNRLAGSVRTIVHKGVFSKRELIAEIKNLAVV